MESGSLFKLRGTRFVFASLSASLFFAAHRSSFPTLLHLQNGGLQPPTSQQLINLGGGGGADTHAGLKTRFLQIISPIKSDGMKDKNAKKKSFFGAFCQTIN